MRLTRRSALLSLLATTSAHATVGGGRLKFGRPVVIYDMLISNLADMQAFNEDTARANNPGRSGPTGQLVVAIAPGTYGRNSSYQSGGFAWALGGGAAGAGIIFKALDPLNKPVIDAMLLQPSSVTVEFESLIIGCSDWIVNNGSGALSWSIGSHSNSYYFRNGCEIRGGYRGNVLYDIDPTNTDPNDSTTNRYPECANFLVTKGAGNSIASITVPAKYIGDNMTGYYMTGNQVPDGTYPITTRGAGSGFTGTFDVVGGNITNPQIITPGSGYTAIVQATLSWAGQVTMSSVIPSGGARVHGGGVILLGELSFQDCIFHPSVFTNVRLNPNGVGSKLTFLRNKVRGAYSDCMNLNCDYGATPPQVAPNTTIWFNEFTRSWGVPTDGDNPHGDTIQMTAGSGSDRPVNTIWPISIVGNLMSNEDSRGITSGLLSTKMGVASLKGLCGYYVGNGHFSVSATDTLSLGATYNLMVYGNTHVRYNYPDSRNAGESAPSITGVASGPTIMGNNVFELFSVNAGIQNVDTVTYPNVLRGAAVASTWYPANFSAPLGLPASLSAFQTAFATIGASSGKGMFSSGCDFVNKTLDFSALPRGTKINESLDVDPSGTVTTPVAMILGGAPTGNWSLAGTGFAIQFYDDDLLTNPTGWLTVSGTTTLLNRWYQLRWIGTGSASTAYIGALTLDGYTFNWSVITAPAVQYDPVANGDAAWSSATIPGGQITNATKLIFAKDIYITSFNGNDRLWSGASNYSEGLPTGAPLSLTLSGVATRTANGLPIGQWMRLIVLVDLTQAVSTDRVQILLNTSIQDLNLGSTTITATSLSIASLYNSVLALFATTVGGSIPNIQARMDFRGWGTGISLPPTTTLAQRQALYTSLSRDNIGSSGQNVWPNAQSANLLFHGPAGASDGSTPNTWNATGGLTNRGSIVAPLIKQSAAAYSVGTN